MGERSAFSGGDQRYLREVQYGDGAKLADDGASVVGIARPSDELRSLSNGLPPVFPVPLDVTDPGAVVAAFGRAVDEVGAPTLLVSCAGSIDALGPVATADPERWWRTVTVDLRGTMLCARAALSTMLLRGAGRIVTVYGNLGDDGRAHLSAFAAAKAGVVRFTETLASELAGTGVVAVWMHPGLVHTPMTEHIASGADGQRWIPGFGGFAREHWGDGATAVTLVRRIVAGEADELSGRLVYDHDDLASLAARCRTDVDLHRLRIRILDHRDGERDPSRRTTS